MGLRRTVRLLPVAVLTDSSLSTSFVACQPDTPKGMNVFIKPHRVAPYDSRRSTVTRPPMFSPFKPLDGGVILFMDTFST